MATASGMFAMTMAHLLMQGDRITQGHRTIQGGRLVQVCLEARVFGDRLLT
jgi:hypothetical protein